jgi:hypothetical protein
MCDLLSLTEKIEKENTKALGQIFQSEEFLLLKFATPIFLARVLTHSCQHHDEKIRCVLSPHIASPFIGV